ncbi:TetR/AcrR family transcriptional regulator [Kineococcus gypseus]|uniref:TetR/AcrR family transcriptional regulator n=1 Tax=Kineococcus gypseus TaxID=1637102 RepID=UPI003D7D3AB3
MTRQSFHHGNLRAVLLEQAERALRESGVDDLSLRDLARRAGVSHGAPRSHFIDRQALLDALAERGFARLTEDVTAAGAGHPDDLAGRLRAVAGAYVRFAVTDAALMELMFSAKSGSPAAGVSAAAGRLFSAFDELFHADFAAGRFRSADPTRTRLLIAAVVQGVASLIVSGRIPQEHGDGVVDEAVGLLLADGRHPDR